MPNSYSFDDAPSVEELSDEDSEEDAPSEEVEVTKVVPNPFSHDDGRSEEELSDEDSEEDADEYRAVPQIPGTIQI